MYVALSTLWLVLVATGLVAIATIFLLRDYQRVDGRTELAEVRCEAVGPDRLPNGDPHFAFCGAGALRFLEGNACVVWVNQVELRPGFAILGVRAVSRIDSASVS